MSLFNLKVAERRGGQIGGGNYNPFENPSVPLSSVALDQPFGKNANEEVVTANTAFALPIFFRCVSLLSGLAASCPLEVFKNPGKKPQTVTSLDPGNTTTLYTQFELWELIMVHLLVWGNAYVQKVRDSGDRIIDLRPVNPALVTVKPGPDGQKIFLVKQTAQDGSAVKVVPLTTFEIMHIPGLGYDGLCGMSVVTYAQQTLGTTTAADKLASRFYSRGTQLTGIINVKAPLASQEQADAIRRRWLAKNAGVGHAAEVAVLDAETTFQPITIPPDQLQFLQSRTFQRSEISTWFGVPPFLVGDTEKTTSWGSGIEQMNTAFVAYTLQQWLRRIEQRVTREVVLTRGQYAEFLLDGLLRGDTTERFNAYGVAIQWGWMTRNEARLKENLEPIEGLDEPLTPINMAAGQVKLDPLTGKPTGAPKGDLEGPLTSAVKPGSGKDAADSEAL